MSDATGLDSVLKDVARVLLYCFILTMSLILVWFFFIVFAWDLTFRVHTHFLDITRQQFDLVHNAGISLTKAAAFILFLIPYFSIRIVLRNRTG